MASFLSKDLPTVPELDFGLWARAGPRFFPTLSLRSFFHNWSAVFPHHEPAIPFCDWSTVFPFKSRDFRFLWRHFRSCDFRLNPRSSLTHGWFPWQPLDQSEAESSRPIRSLASKRGKVCYLSPLYYSYLTAISARIAARSRRDRGEFLAAEISRISPWSRRDLASISPRDLRRDLGAVPRSRRDEEISAAKNAPRSRRNLVKIFTRDGNRISRENAEAFSWPYVEWLGSTRYPKSAKGKSEQ